MDTATVSFNPNQTTDEHCNPSQPFTSFAEHILPQSLKRSSITAVYRCPETELIPILLNQSRLSSELSESIHQLAYRLANTLRHQKKGFGRSGIIQGLLQEFSLSSQEGVALMCLAEALLRIPDKATRDRLIRDKISRGNWHTHLGNSPSPFVNAATWGLLLTGKLVATHNETHLTSTLNRIIGKSGEPIIRKAINMAMRLLGEQFVTGETINQALINARKHEEKGFRYSYDMLGEAALTEEDAKRYLLSYEQAIHAIGQASNGRGIYEGPGISIKLSALHPRYTRTQYQRVISELYPRLLSLTLLARHYDIGINIDAEEADRLDISLDLLERLCFAPQLSGWNGIGFVVQAYQKRCPYVIDFLVDLAQRSERRLMIRLVKGAYWDSEIKRSQVDGLEGYPVYTRKEYTDIAYLACARKLLLVPKWIYPQFATHNAHTLAAVYHMAGQNYYAGQYEFQCLHGMGESLYEQVVGPVADGKLNRPCRIYAPVGTHETLLAYLVRRLLENGANTSFVNRIADTTLPLEQLIEDPQRAVDKLGLVEEAVGRPHPKIPLPRHLYGESRQNARGLDLSNEQHLAKLSRTLLVSGSHRWQAEPIILGSSIAGPLYPVRSPANFDDIVGYTRETSPDEVTQAIDSAVEGAEGWSVTPVSARTTILDRAALMIEDQLPQFVALLVREAGKTFANAISEVREAVDFIRYYSYQARQNLTSDAFQPLGVVVCISPWNFPLAIFTGQISAALVTGNSVLAKPAEQTPLIAAKVVQILLDAGIPPGVLQFLPGNGESVGDQLVRSPNVSGVMFTGSTAVAKLLQRNIANRLNTQGQPVPLIAETGGLNAMIVDSSALTEQVVTDIIASAFDSAGQRCSALRLLCLQDEVADRTINMLKGAMAEYRLGNPEHLSTDIGPVIDQEAKVTIERHIDAMRIKGKSIYQAVFSCPDDEKNWLQGTFVKPTLIELHSIDELQQEIFGPVLHIVRYQRQDLDRIINQINASGYGLTLGTHTRIDETITHITENARVGNIYVNRNMVGAVVGVQPFGGEKLSGTGPKAGGPLYLYRLVSDCPQNAINTTLTQLETEQPIDHKHPAPFMDLMDWIKQKNLHWLAEQGHNFSIVMPPKRLPGPTGEINTYILTPKQQILCLADNENDLLLQLTAVVAVGCHVLWPNAELQHRLYQQLPASIQQQITFDVDWVKTEKEYDAVIFHGEPEQLKQCCQHIAQRTGPIVSVQGLERGATNIRIELLLTERCISINTTAAGGNASLMNLNL